MQSTKPVYGIALEGGGAKGAFHMGAYKALRELGVDIGAVAGTSIGALNGAIIAQGDFETGYEWWERMDTSMLFDIEKTNIEKHMGRLVSNKMLQVWASLARDMIGNHGLDTKKIRNILDELLDETSIRRSKIDFGLVTISVTDWKPVELYKEDIPQGKLIDYLMASANLPVFNLKPLDGKYYLAGGFYDNCPVNLLGKRGIKDIIAIRTFGMGRIRKVDKGLNVINIFPSKDLGKILIFDNGTIKENLKMGYCDVMKHFTDIRGKEYYIRAVDDEKLLGKLVNLPQKELSELAEEMCFTEPYSENVITKKMLPEICRAAGIPGSGQCQDTVIAVLEHAAKVSGIERYEVYGLKELARQIKKQNPSLDFYKSEELPVLAVRKQRRNVLMSKAARVFLKNIKF